jgi:hypothetical protein
MLERNKETAIVKKERRRKRGMDQSIFNDIGI